MAFELSRVDRLTKTYDLAARFPDLDGPFTAAEVALLPPRSAPTGATLWESVGVTAGIATVLFAGPDADSSGAVVVTGSADLWLRVAVGSEVDAAKAERITLLGGGTVIAPGPLPQVLSVQGRTGAVVLDAADVGAPTTTDLSSGLATKVNSSTYTAGLAGKQDKTHVVVDPAGGGTYTTLAAAFAAFPAGNVWIELVRGAHTLTGPLTASGVPNVTITGQGRDATVLTCTAGFIDASANSDQWTVSDLFVTHATGTNTDNGIVVDYPRRWTVRNCRIEGFGGDSIWYRGGIHSWIERNIISARDSTGTNGHAGIRIDRSVALVVPTTIITRGNYVVGGVQYGLYVERGNVGCLHEGDVAESCAVGMRWDTSSATIIAPYTEANTVGIQLFDSAVTIVGRLRDEPVVTWLNVAAADRVITRMDRYFMNPGKGFIFGGPTGGSDPNTSVSERFGTGSPEGVVTGVVGSTFRRINGGVGATLYVKETGTGNTGWVAHGAGLTGDQLDKVRGNDTGVIHTLLREAAVTTNAVTAGTVYLSLFTPSQAMTVTTLAMCSGTAWAGSTLTRMGLYSVSGTTATLVAATANDTTTFQVANTAYTKALDTGGGLPSTYVLAAGQRYAVGVLGVGISAGTLRGALVQTALATRSPLIAATAGTGQTDLPVGPVAITGTGLTNWAELRT